MKKACKNGTKEMVYFKGMGRKKLCSCRRVIELMQFK